MHRCGRCSCDVADEFRFCPHCGAPQRTKVVEYFRGHPKIDDGGLRVSAYLGDPRHVRLSIWRAETAESALSLDPAEARRLGRFLLAFTPERAAPGLAAALLRSVRALRTTVTARRSGARHPG